MNSKKQVHSGVTNSPAAAFSAQGQNLTFTALQNHGRQFGTIPFKA
jgi:hypothetical protein